MRVRGVEAGQHESVVRDEAAQLPRQLVHRGGLARHS
ncbi:hypothetical protein SMD44_08962 [Streptomyces alboflavus]|uniref:Uncharacterized protein n=1 Tax=Streptomyces alboflavus TaxID=67267 RepID=A0A1Z1WSR6_9ACTN|nr:hypothetical protein SMD44_08962 [Streptomyces alboflavus]